MATDIYDLRAKAFDRVSAYVVARDGEKVATIAFKFPADGAGRLYVYAHWFGLSLQRAFASGYGYDKRTAACITVAHLMDLDAADNAAKEIGPACCDGRPWLAHYRAFVAALRTNDGYDWSRNLEKAGFTVWQAV